MQKITLTERRLSVTVRTVNPTKILGIKRGEQMKLSTRAIYGLRAMITWVCTVKKETVSIQSISGRQNISVSYLEQLMGKLKRSGLVESTRGACGGYRLGRDADKISVGDILRVLEGGLEAAHARGRRRMKTARQQRYLRCKVRMEKN